MTRAAGLVQRKPAKPESESIATQGIVDAFHRLYYDRSNRTWLNTHWLGVPVAKCPLDLWIYQELVYELRPDVIIECGTFRGGSALYLASLCDLVDHGRVYSVDVTAHGEMPTHPRLECVSGSSVSPGVLEYLRERIGPQETVLVILDSDHTKEHVRAEIELYSRLVTPGSYLIVEDTNINGHPVLDSFGPGPMEALDEFLRTHPWLEVDREREKFFLTFNPRGYLRLRTRPPESGRRPIRSTAHPEALAHSASRELSPLDRSRDTARSRTLRMVGTGKAVLLLGGGDGASLARPLVEQECGLVLLEPDPRIAARLAETCSRVIVDDPSGVDWERELGATRFDAIVAVDALERLEDPAACLRRFRRFLRPDGILVASVRNVAHGDMRLALLSGVFEPDPLFDGLTPTLQFFTRQTVEVCFDRGGFAIRTLERIHRRVDTARRLPEAGITGPIAQWLVTDEDATTGHFVVTATPLRHGSERVLRERVRVLVAESEALRAELSRVVASGAVSVESASLLDLRRQLERRDALIEQIQAQLLRAQADLAPSRDAAANAEDQLKRHHENAMQNAENAMHYAASLRAAIEQKEQDLGRAHSALAAAHAELRAVHSSVPWRIGRIPARMWRWIRGR